MGQGWLIWMDAALQGLRYWPLAELSQILLWLLLWAFLVLWGLTLAVAQTVTTANSPLPPWPAPFPQLLNLWPLAAALFPALLGLVPVVPPGLRGLFRFSLLALIAVVTLYGQTRTTTDQQREQRRQLLAFADEAANLVVAAGNRRTAAGDRRAEEDQRRALEEAIAAAEASRDQEPAPEG